MSQTDLKTLRKGLKLTDFQDSRSYLRALYEKAKASRASYSYLQFAQDLGFSATNVIRLVIAGRRRLGRKSGDTIARTLGLHGHERRYFLALVEQGQARGANAWGAAFREMMNAKLDGLVSGVSRDRLRYFSEWYYPVVRELARTANFRADGDWIATLLYPTLSPDRAAEALDVLSGLGLLPRHGQEESQAMPPLLPEGGAEGLALTRFHQAMLAIAEEALVKVPSEEREYNALTVSLSQTTFARLKAKLQDLCIEIMAMDQQETARDHVVQVNIQAFQLTKTSRP